MVIAFPAILVNHSGNVNQHKVTFVIEKENAASLSSLAIDGIGKQFLVIAYEVGEEFNAVEQLSSQQKEGRTQLMRQMHAIINDIAQDCDVSEEVVKSALRAKLQASKLITSSVSELTEPGVAQAIFILKSTLSAKNFDYDNYAKNIN